MSRIKADEITHENGSVYVTGSDDGAVYLRAVEDTDTVEVKLCEQQARDLIAAITEALDAE